MQDGFFRQLLLAKVHTLVGVAFVFFIGGSAVSLTVHETAFFEPALGTEPFFASHARGSSRVLGVRTPSVVTWVNATNVITEEGDLEQVGDSCQGCAVAGANSSQKIIHGDGYFEFTTAPEAYYYVYAGLNTDVSSSTAASMPFTFEIHGSYVSVRENGVYKSDTPFTPGDMFRVAIESGVVRYYKNGTVFYTSLAAPVYPLVADVSMQSVGSKLWAGKIALDSGTATPPPPVNPPPVKNIKPVGSLDSVSKTTRTVNGWTKDPNHENEPNKVHLYFDGKAGTPGIVPYEIIADKTRSDVGNHGFSFPIPAKYMNSRWHTVYAYGIDMDDQTGNSNTHLLGSPKRFVFKPAATPPPPSNTPPRGSLDGIDPTTSTVYGWAEDPDNLSSPIDVHLYFNANAGTAGATAVVCRADKPRPDLPTGSHGFACPVPAAYMNGISHTVWAWGIDLTGGSNTQLSGSPKSFTLGTPPTPTTIVDGYGDTLSLTKFDGWFFSQVGDTSATITYENTSTLATVTQTATRTVSRTDAEQWLKTTYGTGFTITQPLGFSVNPSTVVTTPGTYRIKSVKLNQSNTTILLGTGAQGTFTVAGTPPAGNATVTVNAAQRFQTMNGWEAVAQAGALRESSSTGTSNLDPNFALYKDTLFDQAVNDLGLNRLRIELISGSEHTTDYFTQYVNGQLTFNEWKSKWYDPVNDNTSPTSANGSGFKFSHLDFQIDQVVLPIKQRLGARGEQLFLNMCFVDFAGTSFEHYANAEEYAELVVEAYKHMQAKYGFVPDTLEIALEPDNTSFNGTYMGQAMQATATRLIAAGFTPKFIMPSTTSMSSANSYFDAAVAVVGSSFITQYVEELSYHRYTGVSTSALQGIASRANQHGIKTGMLEWIGADYNTLHEDLKVGNVSGWEQYALAFPGGFDDGSIYYSINGTSVTIGSRTKYLRQYFKYVRKGAVRIGGSSQDSALDPVAFQNSDGKLTVVVKATAGKQFTVGGLPAGNYGIMYTVNGTTTNSSDVNLISGNNLSTSIPNSGVITIYQK